MGGLIFLNLFQLADFTVILFSRTKDQSWKCDRGKKRVYIIKVPYLYTYIQIKFDLTIQKFNQSKPVEEEVPW